MGTELNPSPTTSSSSKVRTALALGVIAALLGGAFAGPASAEAPPPAPAAQAVSYADLDLSRPADAEALLARITVAARDACDDSATHSPLFPRASHDFRTCTSEAVDAAVARINQPALTALAAPANQPVQSPVGALASR